MTGDPTTDRDALAGLLQVHGLPAGEAARLAAGALTERHLVAPAGSAPRSRLGGPALLPPGTDWPGGTFVAGLDLTELSASGLPDGGWLLVFSGLDPADAAAGVTVLDVPPGVDPVPADGPALTPHPVVGRAVLALPELPPADLDPALHGAFRAAGGELWDLAHAIDAPASGLAAGHQVGGGAGDEGEAVLLLRLQTDAALGFRLDYDRALELRADPADAARRDWSRVTALDVHEA